MSRDQPFDGRWEILESKSVFSGGPIRKISIETVRLPSGRVVPDYYQIQLSDYALIYAEMPDGTIPVLRQYKHGLRRVCLGFPGGAVDAGETPLAAAQREFREELGYAAGEWTSLGAFVTNANQRCNSAHLFAARRVEKVGDAASHDLEDAEVLFFRRAQLLEPERIRDLGQPAHVALLFLADHVRCATSRTT